MPVPPPVLVALELTSFAPLKTVVLCEHHSDISPRQFRLHKDNQVTLCDMFVQVPHWFMTASLSIISKLQTIWISLCRHLHSEFSMAIGVSSLSRNCKRTAWPWEAKATSNGTTSRSSQGNTRTQEERRASRKPQQ